MNRPKARPRPHQRSGPLPPQRTSCGTREVARNLCVLRHAKGLSQEELADRAEINRNYVGMLASGRNIPPRSTGWKSSLTSSKSIQSSFSFRLPMTENLLPSRSLSARQDVLR